MPICRPYLLSLALAAFGCAACATAQEPSPCSPADYAVLSATCGDDDVRCDELIEERQRLCAEKIRGDQ